MRCRYGATETAAAASLTVGSDFSCFVDAHVGPPMAHSTIALRDVGEMNYFVGDASDYATDEAITAKFQSVFPQKSIGTVFRFDSISQYVERTAIRSLF